MNISKRIQLGFVLVLALGIGVLLPLFLNQLDQLMQQTEQRALQRLHQAALDEIQSQEDQAVNLALALAQQPSIQLSFAQQDRNALREELVPVFSTLSEEVGIEQMQFHLPPATSFLRLHRVGRHGDDLSSFRHTVVAVNETREPVSGIEVGRAGIGIRGVVPMFWRGEHTGSFEFGLSLHQTYADAFKASQAADLAIYLPEGEGFKQLVSTWQGVKLFSESQLQAVMAGETQIKREEYEGKQFAALAAPLKNFSGDIIGVMTIYSDRSQGVAAFQSTIYSTLIVAAVILLAGLLVSWFLAQSIIQPIKRLNRALKNIAEGDQDLRRRIPVEGSNELSDVAVSFNLFVEKVEATVLSVLQRVGQLGSRAEYTFRVTDEASVIIKRQQASTEEVSAAMNEMSATAAEIAGHAAETATATEQADRSSEQGSQVVENSSQGISRLAADVDEAAQVIRKLDEYSEQIGSILDVISGISEQTNLLALNAAIEAARAGEHGRGFAVVADEVRQLAQRSQEATTEIHSMIARLQEGVENSVKVIEQSHRQAEETVEQTQVARRALEEITQAMDRISQMSTQIASAAEEQTAVSEDINRHIITISDGARETVDHTGNIVAATSDIGSEISALMKEMRTFKVNIDPKVELSMAKSAHRAWKVRLRSFLDGQSSLSPDQAVDHHQCDLGRWYDTDGLKHFGDYPEMQALKEPHKRMHQLIRQIIEAKHAGRLQEAEQDYEEVEVHSEEIVALLNQLIAKLDG
ncbi:methyl-accepting chemotaxis protein [Marinospirillum perlucidum]|uniref:methyl-accepting chemotaxis protein n=1 Tax=Marinospirillum perlucidum TaxID=1982602 RepID=UPI00138FBA11|nr:methyl-accepting chemotaxis protein [Marinospirillum perlucidum]